MDKASYSFYLNDYHWKDHLKKAGYAVIKNVASTEEVKVARHLLERDLASLNLPSHGLLAKLAQSEGAWTVRGIPKVKEAFTKIWDTEDLIVSMDAIISWRLWKGYDPSISNQTLPPRPRSEGLHLDQNPFDKPYLDCVQGMIPLLPVNTETGGLQVVPSSHLDENKNIFKNRYPSMKGKGDWCLLSSDDHLYKDAVLLLAEPGDLILWDSRTVHGGRVGTGNLSVNEYLANDKTHITCDAENIGECEKYINDASSIPFVRLSVCVAMTPRSKASEEVLQARRDGFERGISFNHCPHEAGTSTGTIKDRLPEKCQLPVLSKWQQHLL